MTRPTAEVYAELIELRNRSGKTLYYRLTLADSLLSDQNWITDPSGGGGDESVALDRLEETCFGDVCGALSLPEMLELLHATPQESVWKQNRYNLKRMHAEMKARQEAKRTTNTPTPRKETSSPKKTSNTSVPQEKHYQELSHEQAEMIESQRQEIKRLKGVVQEQSVEIRNLKRKNKRLERILHKLQNAVGELQGV